MVQVSMREMNTDEPLVEASIVGNTLSEGMSYMGFPKSIAAVNRCWLCGNRSKGGMTRIQALLCNRGEPAAAGKKTQGGITIKMIIDVAAGSQTSS
ncbi:MAG: hypothetical protein IPM85_18435 [Chitinophagaceae bacterium]|nr:hypothetical protein [Chitinophagaceae bacterium]